MVHHLQCRRLHDGKVGGEELLNREDQEVERKKRVRNKKTPLQVMIAVTHLSQPDPFSQEHIPL